MHNIYLFIFFTVQKEVEVSHSFPCLSQLLPLILIYNNLMIFRVKVLLV